MSKASLSSSPIVHPISHSFPVFSSLAHFQHELLETTPTDDFIHFIPNEVLVLVLLIIIIRGLENASNAYGGRVLPIKLSTKSP
ncbi:hypothetical protein WAI453_005955 [Rhynchosporium graminicola]